MWVKLNKSIGDSLGVKRAKGEVVDIDADTGEDMIAKGEAEAAAKPEEKPAKKAKRSSKK